MKLFSSIEEKLKKFWVLTFICFIVSFSSIELIGVILPLSLIGLEVLRIKKPFYQWLRKMVFRLSPLFLVFGIYLYLDLFKIGLPGQVSY